MKPREQSGMSAPAVTPLDAYLLLSAISQFRGWMLRTRVQKTIFCAEEQALRESLTPFPTFKFFRWNHGPFSKELAQTEDWLVEHGFVSSSGGPVTTRGTKLLADLRPSVLEHQEARIALLLIERYGERFSKLTLSEVLRQVYSMVWKKQTIAETVEGENLLEPKRSPELLAEYQPLFDLIRWRLRMTPEEEKEFEDPELLSEPEAEEFWSGLS
ncbi:MAG: hypothetical protein V3V67_04640 [Myxococcota bacterium]